MDIDVIDEEGQHENTDDGDEDYNEGGELNSAGISVVQKNDVDAEPHVGMKFDSASSAKTFYDDYARRMGFSIRAVQHIRAKCDGVVVREFVCARDSSNQISGDSCDAMLRIELKNHAEWVVSKFVKEHSHSTMGPSKVHYLRPRRHFAGGEKTMAETYQGVIPNGVMSVLVDRNHAALETNRCAKSAIMDSNHAVKNSGPLNYVGRHVVQKRTLGRDAQNLLDYFKKMQAQNPGFYYAVQLDDDNRIASVFWADSKSRTAYSHFGDTVTLDTSYRVNQYRVPVAPFTGVNHHGQPILFGCALLYDESDAAYVWLLKTFLSAMSDHAPVSIVTESDKALQSAVSQVFPEARHCISKWHMLREGHERLGHICHAHPNFQVDLYNCINLTDTIEEFELAWDSILDKYDVRRNEWLQSLYGKRTLWAPVYFRDAFFAAISLTQRFESSFFDGYVNQETTVPLFFRQYERALENSFRNEKEADYDTICTVPVLRTPSPMEKQAANLYTRKIFLKFQEELVETFVYTANRIDGDEAMSMFRVAKFEDDHKAYMVSLNLPAMRANCSCQMFEYSGILCRHILTVFTVTNVLTLPSHYILRRWTRNAKSWVGSDDRGELAQESLAVRYNSLCREAIKYAEEGATAPETYNAAMTALREGWKKVLSVKKNVAKVAPPSSHVSVIGYEDRRTSTPDMTPLLWPRQDEVARCFNLNDGIGTAQSIADLNLPRMAPVSLRRDVGQSDNMVILPCLKSMTWVMENKNSVPANRVAVISLKLQDYSRTHSAESEVKFQLSTLTLEPMLRSMAYISEQLSTPANRVAVINLKLQDTETTSGESEVKFQVSRDTLAAMLRSMAYIREQLANPVESHVEMPPKKPRR